jgi:hypothetical protein
MASRVEKTVVDKQALLTTYVEKVLNENIPADRQDRSKEMLRDVLTNCFLAGVAVGREIELNA